MSKDNEKKCKTRLEEKNNKKENVTLDCNIERVKRKVIGDFMDGHTTKDRTT